MNFEYFLLDQVLEPTQAPILWFLDEADRLFSHDFYSEVFGLMRSWHNDRGVQPLWQRLTLALAYATETHLFIHNPFQSPFNVGTRLEMEAFTLEQVSDLNERYGSPLRDAAELARYRRLTGGHPYLTRRGFAWLARTQAGIEAFAGCADQDNGPLGDHLRRMRAIIMQPEHAASLRQLLQGQNEISLREFYQLRSAGIITGDSPAEAVPTCDAYAGYLRRYLIR
jgi:catechol 2,3-dioxygenase-like lactoylglutathione lyase family enzyme